MWVWGGCGHIFLTHAGQLYPYRNGILIMGNLALEVPQPGYPSLSPWLRQSRS